MFLLSMFSTFSLLYALSKDASESVTRWICTAVLLRFYDGAILRKTELAKGKLHEPISTVPSVN